MVSGAAAQGAEVTVDLGDLEPVRGEGWTITLSGRYVQVEDRQVPDWIEIEIDGDDLQPTTIMRAEVRDGFPQVVEVRFVSRPGEREVRQADLRSTEVASMLTLVAGFAVQLRVEEGQVLGVPGIEDLDSSVATIMRSRTGHGVRKITPKLLERVAEIYRANIDDRPTQAVRSHFVVSERMASEYVQRARRAGFLPETTPGKKKG